MINVTITGADDTVDPRKLYALSQEFPFVEWAILFSEKRESTPRYPSEEWIKMATSMHVGRKGFEPSFAAHVCGSLARKIEAGLGDLRWLVEWKNRFRRLQINGWTSPMDLRANKAMAFRDNTHHYGARYILQAREPEALPSVLADALHVGGQVLYDPSGGRGVTASFSDVMITTAVDLAMPETFGFAGGIGPETIERLLPTLPKKLGWVCMESGVRTDDRLDLDKVRFVLEAVDRHRKAGL